MGQFIRKEACPKCTSLGRDHSKDNLAVYEDGSCYCFACHYVKPSQGWLDEHGEKTEEELEEIVGSHFDEAVHEKLKETTGLDTKGYRGIRSDISKFFGVRYSYSEEDGSVTDTYYPSTKGGELVGYKRRIHPKDFTKPLGETGKECDMFMQFRFKTHKDTVLICGGEHDSLASYQMLSDKQKADGKTQWDFTACVSSTTGEPGAWKQAQKQYAFFNQFKKIVLALDNDAAGKEATEKLAKVLPRGKVYVMNLRFKDCNEYLEQGATKEFINDFWGARMYTPAGIHASVDLYKEALDDLDQPKLSLPPFLKTASDMFGGGLVKQEITLILAKTSIGKCLGKDTPVLLSNGRVKLVQDIETGDTLLGPDGSSRNVLSTVKGREAMYRIEQDKGITYEVNESHILSLVYTANGSKRWKRGEVVNIEVRDYLSLTTTERKFLKGYKASLEYFGSGDMFEPYMFGLWLADGTSDKAQWTFNKDDTEVIEEFNSFCKRNNYTSTLSPSADRSGCFSPVVSAYTSWLKSNGVFGRKHIPDEYKTLSRATRIEILSGFLDGDGYNCGNIYEVTMKKGQLCDDIVWIARSLGLCVRVEDKFSKCAGFAGDIYSHIFIKGDLTVLNLRLKRKQIKSVSDRKNNYSNIRVEYIGEGDYFGFCIDGDRLFCLGDFTVTHNTTLLSAMTEHWALNEPNICLGILSLEATAPKYSRNLLSYHLGVPLHRMKDANERAEFLMRPENEAKARNLFTQPDGTPRFYVCDDRGANIEQVKEKILEMVIHMGVDTLLIDPYSDLCSGMTVGEQEELATWVKKLMKEYSVTPIIVSHVRKSASGQNAGPITEDDAQGSSFLVKAAGQTISLERDKMSDDPIERNRTMITILKNRDFSETGPAGSIYYDISTATLHDYDVWLSKQDVRF